MKCWKARLYAALAALVLLAVGAGCGAADVLPSAALSASGSLAPATAQPTPGLADSPAPDDTTAAQDAWTNVGVITLGPTISYAGAGISAQGSVVTITAGGDYTLAGTLDDGQIVVNAQDEVKLRLNGVSIACSTGPAIYFLQSKKSFVTIAEGTVNELSDGAVYVDTQAKAALFSNDTLEIKGSGRLIITGNYKHGIASDDDILIENGDIAITAVTDGLHANDGVRMSGGSLAIIAASDGIGSEGSVVIDGGSIRITGSQEGIEGKTTLCVYGGDIAIACSDDGLNAGQEIVVNGGTLDIVCGGDGIDSNGNLTINGGDLWAASGNNANSPLDIGDRGGVYTVNGGTLAATGGSMGVTVSGESAQRSLWVAGSFAEGAQISVTDQSGQTLFSFTARKDASLIYLSSPLLLEGGVYTAAVNGSVVGSATLSGKSASIGKAARGMGGFGGPGRR